MPKEELGCSIDRETSGYVLEVNGLVGFEVGNMGESPVDVLVKEAEI